MSETQPRIRAGDFARFLSNYGDEFNQKRKKLEELQDYTTKGREQFLLIGKNLYFIAYVGPERMVDIVSISSGVNSEHQITRENRVWEIVANKIADKYNVRLEKFYGSFKGNIDDNEAFKGSLEDLRDLMDNLKAAQSELEAKIQREAERILREE